MSGILKFVLKFLVLLVIVSVAVVLFAGGGVAKYMINFHSERLTGVKMSVAGAELSILNGQMTLNNLAIANPAGYTDTNAATIESVRVSLQPKTVLEGNVVVDFIGITGLRAQFEGDNKSNNFTALQAQMEKRVSEQQAQIAKVLRTEGKEEAAEEKPMTFMIKQLEVRDTAVTFRPVGTLAKVIDKPVQRKLDDILLTDIGTAEGGKTMTEVMNILLAPLFQNLQREVMKVFADPQTLLNNVSKQVKEKVGGFLDGLLGR